MIKGWHKLGILRRKEITLRLVIKKWINNFGSPRWNRKN